MNTTEKRFESDIEAFFLSAVGGYSKCDDVYDPKLGLYKDTLLRFIKDSQPKAWQRFVNMNAVEPEKKFCLAFNNACDMDGILHVLRHGFKHRGVSFKVCYFMPESALNQTDVENYGKNIFNCIRQWHYSADNKNSVDMLLAVNGIPVFAFELKNQFTGQSVENAKRQWKQDRDPREICFQFNKRILAYFCVDLSEAWMTTKLAGDKTYFLPFNQGSNGAGNDGGKGNPANPDGYPTDYLWKQVFPADSMMDIIQKFISLQDKKLIFPRFHQLDVVRKLVADVKANGAGHNYLIQHSAGSGKSNSIAWTAYRLASLHDDNNNAIFSSVIVVTDRRVLDAQLQATISGFDHTLGVVETIGEDKNSQALKDAINDGVRIIVTTLQKFPVIYEEVDKVAGRNYAIICDEAHSSQTGSSAQKMKTALADLSEALKEYAKIEGIAEDKVDPQDKLVKELISHGKHKNLSFFAFTATPKDTTLEMFGEPAEDGSFHPFHIYSMHQAIEEGFILDVLQNYMTYKTCFKIANSTPDNPEVPASRASKVIKKYQQLHPENIRQKSEIIVETFMTTTRGKINGKAKMMVVTASRPAAVLYFKEIKRYAEEKGYAEVKPMVAFSGELILDEESYTEPGLNVRPDGSHIQESQTKQEFHDNFNILIVAEKFQTGFDEPLLHTMIVDKKLRGVKTVQTLSRLNRTCPGKNDTFILDFANEKEDVQDDFQVFYHETILQEEVNTDLLYKVQRELRDYHIYDDNDIKYFCEVYFAKGAQGSSAQGMLASKLLPAVGRYNGKTADERYQIRRSMRNFCKWYRYVSQVVRMFDKDLHEEYVYCSFLVGMLPSESVPMEDIEKMLKLEMYKLEKTFEGDISLGDESGVYMPAEPKGRSKPEDKDPLDEIIERINERYKGNFTDADKVMIGALAEKLRGNKKLANMASSSDPQIFAESIFPQAFSDAAQDSYMESQETYSSLFEDQSKYNAIMGTLADIIYREMRRPKGGNS
ncbi:MAG: type I restriction endonuclease subunit R [Clostridia bacterium]|nr:type I restriction endonuclease subunit R [Clostridia bacterium]